MDGRRSIGNHRNPLLRNFGHGWVDQNGNPVGVLSASLQAVEPTPKPAAKQPPPEDKIQPINAHQ